MKPIDRNLEDKVERLLRIFPAVALVGARQVGKTVLSKKLRPTWRYVDLENPNEFERISRDHILYFEHYPSHIIFDEAQSYPQLFNVLRGIVDARREEKGRFILTCSSSPELLSQISESLSERCAGNDDVVLDCVTIKNYLFWQITHGPAKNNCF